MLPFTGAEYLASLDDGREVWLNGKRVKQVTSHPGFRNAARMMARLYDSLHNPASAPLVTCPTDTGNGGFTHKFFRLPNTTTQLLEARNAIAHWARLTYGWMGRTPDYKAALLGTLGANGEFYRPYHLNAERWYRLAQERVLFLNHAIVNPPTARGRHFPKGTALHIRVVKETDRGVLVSGAKAVATGAAFTHHCFIAHAGAPPVDKRAAITFVTPTNAPGLKLLCRSSYELNAHRAGTPFDNPLASRLDENDTILLFDRVEVPWENVFLYDVEQASQFVPSSGFQPRAFLHSCTRLAVKLDFIVGAVVRAVELAGNIELPLVQEKLGELVGWRTLFWALSDAMVHHPVPWLNGTVQPNPHYGHVFRMLAQEIYPRIRNNISMMFSTGLIFSSSHSVDFATPELEADLELYLRGTGGTASDRHKVMRLVWESVNSEFGARQELYELMHLGSPQVSRSNILFEALRMGDLERSASLLDTFLGEYDPKGWTAPDLQGPSARGARKRRRR